MQLKLDISDLNAHKEAAEQLLEFAGAERIFLFDAPMGSGKTTIIKSICGILGVIDTTSSPTYSIVNEYQTQAQTKLFHLDLYRVLNSSELFDLGFEEYLDSGSYIFVEWPELALPFVNSYVNIKIKMERNKRYIYAFLSRNL